MIKIVLPIALENRLRAGEGGEVGVQILALVDLARARTSEKSEPEPGPGWPGMCRIFRAELGGRIFIPERPNRVWIIRQINRAKELGIYDDLELRRLALAASRGFPRGVELEYVLRTAPAILSKFGGPAQGSVGGADQATGSDGASGDVGELDHGGTDPRVFNGRHD